MNPVEWLQSVLPGGPFVIAGWVIYTALVVWLVTGLLAIAACIHSSRLARELDKSYKYEASLHRRLVTELDRQEAQANSAGPEVTKRTLMDEVQPHYIAFRCPRCGLLTDTSWSPYPKTTEEIQKEHEAQVTGKTLMDELRE